MIMNMKKGNIKASSKMRTVRCSGRLGEGCLPRGGVCLEGVCPRGMSAQGGCLARGCLARGSVCPGEVCAQGGVHLHPPVDRMTDACENITFAQLLLWTVIT